LVADNRRKIPPRRIRRRRTGAPTLTAAQAKDLMEFIEDHHPSAAAVFALCLLRRHPALPPHLAKFSGQALARASEGDHSHRRRGFKVREHARSRFSRISRPAPRLPVGEIPHRPDQLQHLREKAVRNSTSRMT